MALPADLARRELVRVAREVLAHASDACPCIDVDEAGGEVGPGQHGEEFVMLAGDLVRLVLETAD